jgi:hypothetical protein
VPYFKVDDMLHSHPKSRRAGLAAMGLWSLAGSHCMAYKTDGFVAGWFVATWPRGASLAAQLVEAGLWSPGASGEQLGWWFHDWDDVQLTAAEIEADREHSRERQRKYRAKIRENRGKGDTT